MSQRFRASDLQMFWHTRININSRVCLFVVINKSDGRTLNNYDNVYARNLKRDIL